MPYIPHTPEETQLMLNAIQVQDVETLFDEIPESLQHTELNNIEDGMNEMTMLQHAEQLANLNQNHCCFIGAGCYDHHIPAVVWDLTTRGEFLTAYTPYQAEASQGTLQLLYEYQSMIASLTGMEVANASLYDGASALAEAVLMSVRIRRHYKTQSILILGTLHPAYQETLQTITGNQPIELIILPYDYTTGITKLEALTTYENIEITALVISQPNFFGTLEDVDALVNWAHAHNILTIACVNPVSLGLLKPPGEWSAHGVDIVCGDGQPLGAPMASGGPGFGFFSTKLQFIRQMPGRLVGQTLDTNGNIGYTLTLQAREQHIRRGKETSNICTNQGLLAIAATIHMSLLGPQGLYQTALHCHHNTHKLVDALLQVPGVQLVFNAPYFHEALLKFSQPIAQVLTALAEVGIAGGYPLTSNEPHLQNTLLICATEKRTSTEIDKYVNTIENL